MTTGGPSSGGSDLPLADITGRMAVFGRLFSEHVGLAGPEDLPDARALVELVKRRVPRTTQPAEEAPVFEAAAFVGEWLRASAQSAWVAEGPFEPHLQLVARNGAVVYLVPLVSIIRVASSAGYDGLAKLLESILEDVRHPPRRSSLADARILPRADSPRVVAWLQTNKDLIDSSRAVLWRRCQSCSTKIEDSLTLHVTSQDWERDASTAAGVLARRPFACACGGPAGEVSRFVMLRNEEHETTFADIYLGGTHTRVACWRIQGEDATPLDATMLSVDGLVS